MHCLPVPNPAKGYQFFFQNSNNPSPVCMLIYTTHKNNYLKHYTVIHFTYSIYRSFCKCIFRQKSLNMLPLMIIQPITRLLQCLENSQYNGLNTQLTKMQSNFIIQCHIQLSLHLSFVCSYRAKHKLPNLLDPPNLSLNY